MIPAATSPWTWSFTPHELAAVAASGLVDESWYLRTYPDVADAGLPPLLHYLTQGWTEGRDPGPHFSTLYYLKHNLDVAEAGQNPLAHYAIQGWREGRRPSAGFDEPHLPEALCDLPPLTVALSAVSETEESKALTSSATDALPDLLARRDRPAAAPPAVQPLRVVSFYLPQFHPIPENDAWWGSGFTEWTNVVKGVPYFDGHHQPHVPGELGYYDLRDPEVMRRQVELARLHGIEAFCFYAYWFAGKRLLERPLDAFLDDPSLQLGFCVCWANEDWTRTWNGEGDEILIGQQHSPEDDLAFIEEMSRYLRDPRYLKVDGQPLILIYRPSLLPDAVATTGRWRQWCRDNALGEITIAYVQSFDKDHPSVFGCDFAVEFPPNNTNPIHLDELEQAPGFEGQVYDWVELATRSRAYPPAGPELWRGVVPSWDNGARRGVRSAVLWGANPTDFRGWLVNAGEDTLARLPDDKRLLFVNAWNEWAEGAHLEPDEEHGYQWLHAVRDAQEIVGRAPVGRHGAGVVVVAHDLHPHGAQMLALELVRMLSRLGVAVEAVALRDGALRTDFEALAPLHLVDDDGEEAVALAQDLLRRGFRTALCNSSVSGYFAAALKSAGADVTGLVHEMPAVLAQPDVDDRARALSDAADRVWFPSRHVAEVFPHPVKSGGTVVRPQGLYRTMDGGDFADERTRVRQLLDVKDDAKVVLGVGFGDFRKGLDLFAAAAATGLSGADTHYVWLGQPDLFDERITASLAAAGDNRLHMVGFVDDPRPWFRGADVLALPSREDPFPSVVIEALAAGLPVVAFTGCTGQEELLERARCVLTDVAADALASGVVEALTAANADDAEIRTRLVADEFNFRRYVMDLLALTPAALPRVSVVLPNFAYEDLVADRIAQILQQSLPVYELVVLDDASPDLSVARIKDAIHRTDIPVRLVVNEQNSGSVLTQWAKGAELATGDLVWIAEADDIADPTFLETLVPDLADPRVVLAACRSRQVGSDGEELAPDYADYLADVHARDWTRRYVADGLEELRLCMAVKNTIPNVSAVVFRAGPLREVLADPTVRDLPSAGDWAVYVRLLQRGRIVYEPHRLNGHRRHAGSVVASNLGRRHLEEIMTVQVEVAEAIDVPRDVGRTALAYDAELYEQFGLGPRSELAADPGLARFVSRLAHD